ncbi:MAG: trigger factor [Gemmatimonadaceae bacterium]|nr:trigger factor [Gemmatimonadaceae bacterium]
MEFNAKESTGVDRRIQVSVPAETVKQAEEKAARRYATKVRMPGFRQGKAPPAMIQKKFGKEIRQEALESLVRDAYEEVITKQDLKIASQPHIHDVKFEDGKPLTFELHVEVRPTLELARTSGFKITRPKVEITDAQLTEQIEQLRDEKAAWTPVEDKPAVGDRVRVTLSTKEESGEVAEPREYPVELGGGQAIAGIEDLIMQLAPGETVERPVQWPDDFPDEAQRGKTKTVRVTLHDVKRKSAPALDDAFAREVGDFDSLDALKQAVRSDLERHAEREADSLVRHRLLGEIISANPFGVPKSWVRQVMDGYAEAYQIPESEREKFAAEFLPMAEQQVRRDLVIDTLAERENLTATEKDLDDRITELAEKRGANPGQVYASLEKAGRLKELERSLTEDKVFKWLLDQNEVQTDA